MADPSLPANTIFIDVGKGPEPYTIRDFVPGPVVTVTQDPERSNMDLAQPKCKQIKIDPREPDPTDDNPTLHIQTRKIKCPECPKYSAENDEQLDRHIKSKHRGENPFSCYMCDYSTYNKTLFEEHVRIHQGIKPFKCSHCDHTSVSKKNIKKHELIHRADNPLRCKLCSFIAQNLVCLRHHQKKGCGGLLMCDYCDFAGENREEVEAHQLKHKINKCKRCGYRSKLNKNFERHSRTCKGSKYGKFKCKLCEWSSKHDAKILLHLIHHPNQKVDERSIDISVLRKHGIMN